MGRSDAFDARCSYAGRKPAAAMYGNARALVVVGAGGSWYGHAPGDVSEEIDQLHGELMQFGQEILDRVFLTAPEAKAAGKEPIGGVYERPGVPATQNVFYHAVWQPFFNDWQHFREPHHDSFWQNLPLSGAWDRAQDYRGKLANLRSEANTLGFHIKGPAPIDPRKDPSLQGAIEEIWKIVKYVLYGVLGLAGLFALVSLASHVRHGTDPVERYATYAGRGAALAA